MKRVGFVLILLSLLSFSAFSQQTSNSSCLMENGGLMLVPMQEKTGMSSSADVFLMWKVLLYHQILKSSSMAGDGHGGIWVVPLLKGQSGVELVVLLQAGLVEQPLEL